MSLVAGTSSTKSKRGPVLNPLSGEDLAEMQREMNLPNLTMKKLAQQIRSRMGYGAVEPNATRHAIDESKILEEFYTISTVKMEVKRTEEVEVKGKDGQMKKVKRVTTVLEDKEVVHVKDAVEFVKEILRRRGLDPDNYIIKVGADAGNGSFKMMVSICPKSGEASTKAGELLTGLVHDLVYRYLID